MQDGGVSVPKRIRLIVSSRRPITTSNFTYRYDITSILCACAECSWAMFGRQRPRNALYCISTFEVVSIEDACYFSLSVTAVICLSVCVSTRVCLPGGVSANLFTLMIFSYAAANAFEVVYTVNICVRSPPPCVLCMLLYYNIFICVCVCVYIIYVCIATAGIGQWCI